LNAAGKVGLNGEKRNSEAACSLWTTAAIFFSPFIQTTLCICIYLRLYFLFCLQMTRWHTQSRGIKVPKMNNHSDNLEGSTMCDLCAVVTV
jgi:hypothetical protein